MGIVINNSDCDIKFNEIYNNINHGIIVVEKSNA